ncbi:hypothetical protein F5Y01DRAFT_322046 [Xylaria sp. FL0043]|nr:hypothetical protein F5Y01DRAFT_322046 [Xylaria sp. FL0043]
MEALQLPQTSTSGQAHLAETSPRFTLFSSLPPELRQNIWAVYVESLEDRSEVLIHEPSGFVRSSGSSTPTVYTGFPVPMHVNSEARAIAQKRLTFVECPRAPCMVPVRPFRPELDVLFIPWEAWRSFFLLKELHYGNVWLSTVQHVAVDICVSNNFTAFFRQVHHIPSVRTLRLLLASEHIYYNNNSMLILPDPMARCSLRSITAGADNMWALGSQKRFIKRMALGEAEASMPLAPSPEAREVVERFARGRSKLVIEANILTEFRYSPTGPGFVDLGLDNVADLVLPVT